MLWVVPARTNPGGPPLPLEPGLIVSKLVPKLLRLLVMLLVTPLPIEISATTAPTPITTPRVVRILLRTLPRIERQAILKVSSGLSVPLLL